MTFLNYKVEIIDNDIKDIIIEQTIESAKNQEEGTGIQEEDNFTDIVSDIIKGFREKFNAKLRS